MVACRNKKKLLELIEMRENEFVEEQEYALAVKVELSYSDSENVHTYINASTINEAVVKAVEEVKEAEGATGEYELSIEGMLMAFGTVKEGLKPEEGEFNGGIQV